MPEWLDLALKVAGALALMLGPTAVWRGHVLARRSALDALEAKGKAEQAAAVALREANELKEATTRLVADIEVLKARITVGEQGQAVYQAYAEGQARVVDATREELAASRAREVDCQTRLTNAEIRIHVLERQRGAPYDG